MENQENKTNQSEKSETELFFDKLKEFLQTAPKDISYVIMGKGEYNTEALANGILAVKATPEDVSLMMSNSISQGPDTFRLSIELGLERSKKSFNPIDDLLKFILKEKLKG